MQSPAQHSGGQDVRDGNEAAADVAYRLSEVVSIYPITPSSPMGELADDWAARGRPNIFGTVPRVIEMQSEAGAAGTLHGALQAGALATTFTSSQGLLLMIPELYKIAGQLLPMCMHVAARTVATHALSIFGDHSDVMACRQTGMALLASGSVQEAHDLACIGTLAALESRVPCLHFFDGFRTSHEVQRIATLGDEDLRALLDPQAVAAHRERGLSPDRPVLRGSAHNPDTFFQAREAINPYYDRAPQVFADVMERFARRTGRRYGLFEYCGDPQAERVIVVMGSAAQTVRETVEWLCAQGARVGAVIVRLYRPFSAAHLRAVLPPGVRVIGVLDRTKEPGAPGEPLYLDVLAALYGADAAAGPRPRVVGGIYGLSGKEFTPAMVRAVFDALARPDPPHRFTVGITDDLTRRSLPVDGELDIEPPDVLRAVFWGLGADGTVSANRNSVRIVGRHTGLHVQAFFVYDSKKAGAVTVSHLRFSPRPIRSAYLVRRAGFVACHQWGLLERYDVLAPAAPGATFLLNAPYGPEAVWDELPRTVQRQILDRGLRLFVIDATRLARELGLGPRINTIMQVCFFALTDLLPLETALEAIREAIRRTYGRKGEPIVQRNLAAVDAARAHLHEVRVPGRITARRDRPPPVPPDAPDFVRRVTAQMLAGLGDHLPVSVFAPDGTWPTGTARWEKRAIALEIPIWEPELCIQCGKCALVCPHAAIRARVVPPAALHDAPAGFRSVEYRGRELSGQRYVIQVAPEDCTGCQVCVEVCPARDRTQPRRKALNMRPLEAHRAQERAFFDFFLRLPEAPRTALRQLDVRTSQLLDPLFEFSGACAGCGETPYIKLLTQLFGDRLLIANATGCSSIYGGNLPTTPYTVNAEGRGPAWCNSLFEDNAEFGLGLRLALDARLAEARRLLRELAAQVGESLVAALLEETPRTAENIAAQRERVALLKQRLAALDDPRAARLLRVADDLVPRSVWVVGGDGWAYDIGYGGLDHVLAGRHDINVLVLDTEVYSNTGGQASKATPLGAAAKFAVAGKSTDKKDLGLMAMSYGHVYVATVAFGAHDQQTVRAFLEAESYPGPSLIIAYAHCIAHGYDMRYGPQQQKRAVQCGLWPLYRYDPRRVAAGQPPLHLDAAGGRIPVEEYARNETRFRMVEAIDPARFAQLAREAQTAARRRVAVYQHLAALRIPADGSAAKSAPAPAAPAPETH